MESPEAYIPIDRLHALARSRELPDRTEGAALFADISGFAPLTEALFNRFGPRGGAEKVVHILDKLYDALIAEVHGYGGTVISFSGDAITCWFEGDNGRRAVTCALSMQQTMTRFAQDPMPPGVTEPLSIKIAVTAGPARRFVVGDPEIQRLDALAGATLYRMAKAEKQAHRGEVIAGEEVIRQLGDDVHVFEWRTDDKTRQRFAVVSELGGRADVAFAATLPLPSLTPDQARPWLLPQVYARLKSGQGRFLAEILPAVALFLKFEEIDYDGDDAAGEKLDRFVRRVQNILARYEGYLLQLTNGDKGSFLYAAFGAPLAHDDDPARAVAAALELRSLSAELGFTTDVRIGISQGRMRTGAYGSSTRCTYGVLGDEVNVAARLMEEAKAAQVLATKQVADKAGRLYDFEDVGARSIRGKIVPLSTYAVLGKRSPTFTEPTPPFKHPLVGRESELAQIDHLLDGVLTGAGQIFRVEGAAGAGKSHLVSELVKEAKSRGFQVAVGACQSVSQGIAYYPWRWMFRALFELANELSVGEEPSSLIARQIAQVEARVNQIDPSWPARLPLLGELLGLPIPDNVNTASLTFEQRQQWLITLSVELARTCARAQPLLLLVEDAHWMDEASQRLSQSLGAAIAQTPILMALTHRPQDAPLLPDLNHLPYHRHLALRELTPQEVEALVAHRLDGKPSALALALIQTQAQGNPLFAEGLVNDLRESGKLVRDDGTWTLSEPILRALRKANCLVRDASQEWRLARDARLPTEELGIPDSIRATVLSRVGRLPEEHRLTLKVASVIGQTFEFDLLARSHPGHPDSARLREQVNLLAARDFVRLETSAQRLICLFRHSTTQEVIYETLLEDQQRDLHLAVGEALEQLMPEEVERLAYHYDHSDHDEKALFYLDRAAHKAQREFANETALSYYTRALTREKRWEWLKGCAQVWHILGERNQECANLKELERAEPSAPEFEVAYLWGQYYEAIGEFPGAQLTIERAFYVAQRQDDVVGQARCLVQLALIARRLGQIEAAVAQYNHALDLVQDQKAFLNEHLQALNGLGTIYRDQGRFEKTKDCYEQALSLSRTGSNRAYEAQALDNLGTLARHVLDFDAARQYHELAIQIRQEIGDRAGEGTSLYNLALVQIGTGDYGQAIQYLSKALDIHQAVQNRWEMVNILMALGGLCIELGDLDQAKIRSAEGLRLCQELDDQAAEMYIRGNLGLILREQGDLKAAKEQLTQCLVLAHGQRNQEAASMCQSHLAVTSLRANQVAHAIRQARRARRIRDELGLQVLTTANLATLALAHRATGDMPAAANYARQALDILDRCHGEGPEFPHHDYFACYRVLVAAGEHERALDALHSAYRLLMARAAKINDPLQRNSYLERVPIHREIVEEAKSKSVAE